MHHDRRTSTTEDEEMKMPCHITDGRAMPEPQVQIDAEWDATELVQTEKYWTDYGLPSAVAYELAELMQEVENRRTGDKQAEASIVDRAVLLMGAAVQDEVENA